MIIFTITTRVLGIKVQISLETEDPEAFTAPVYSETLPPRVPEVFNPLEDLKTFIRGGTGLSGGGVNPDYCRANDLNAALLRSRVTEADLNLLAFDFVVEGLPEFKLPALKVGEIY